MMSLYLGLAIAITVWCKTVAGENFGESIVSEFWRGKRWRI